MAVETEPFAGSFRVEPAPATADRSRLRSVAAAIEAFFVRHRGRLKWVHAAMFVSFLAVIVVPVFLPEPAEDATPLTHFTLFANYVMWGLWFPLVFLSVIVTGRSWCGLLCPMGAASEWANGIGLKRAIPRWLSWEGTPVVSFLFVTLLGQTVGVRDHPEAIAEVFGGTMLAAVVIGLVYGRRKRAWCRHMCPIGLLLGIFSRLGAVQFTPRRKLPGGDTRTEKGPCPTMIDIARKEESRHCIECFRCVNVKARGGLTLRLRPPGEEVEQIRAHHPDTAETWFFFLGTGIVLGAFLWLILPAYQDLRMAAGGWFLDHGMLWVGEPGPAWLMSVHPERREVFRWLDFFTIAAFMVGFMTAVAAVLSLITAAAASLSGRCGGTDTFKARFVELGYQYAPVAMISLMIGLGGELFEAMRWVGFGAEGIGHAKGLAFAAALAWSVLLGDRILRNQGVAGRRRWIPLIPGIAGSALIGVAWWPAIFGM